MLNFTDKMIEMLIAQWKDEGNSKLRWILSLEDDERIAPFGSTAMAISRYLNVSESAVRQRLNELIKLKKVIPFKIDGRPTKFLPINAKQKINKKLN